MEAAARLKLVLISTTVLWEYGKRAATYGRGYGCVHVCWCAFTVLMRVAADEPGVEFMKKLRRHLEALVRRSANGDRSRHRKA